MLVDGQVVGSVGNKEVLAVHASVMAGKVKVRVVGHGHVGGAVALAAILDAEDAGARHGKHGRKGAVAGQAQLAILKRGGHAHGIVDLVELNIPYALVQAVLKIAVQVVDALVGGHMPVRAVDVDRGACGAVCHGADGRAKAGGVVKVILELIEAQNHIAHVAGNVGHIDTQHGGAIVHNANADLGPVEGVTMNGGTARRGAEKLGSDHLVPNIVNLRFHMRCHKMHIIGSQLFFLIRILYRICSAYFFHILFLCTIRGRRYLYKKFALRLIYSAEQFGMLLLCFLITVQNSQSLYLGRIIILYVCQINIHRILSRPHCRKKRNY